MIIEYSIENLKASGSNNKNFDFFEFEYFAKDIEHLKKSHRHEFYSIIITISGGGGHIIDFQEYEILPNRIFLINYGQVHAWTALENVKGFVVLFTKEFYNLIFTGNDKIKSDVILQNFKPYIDVSKEVMAEWLTILKNIEVEYKKGRTDHKEIICLLLKVLMLKYLREENSYSISNNKANHKHDLIYRYKQLINQHFSDWKLPKMYAPLLNITPNYLNGLCNEIEGATATELIKKRVILEAKRLLTHTDMNVSQIAYTLGFDDKSHFGKYFKKSEKIPPDAYRQRVMEV